MARIDSRSFCPLENVAFFPITLTYSNGFFVSLKVNYVWMMAILRLSHRLCSSSLSFSVCVRKIRDLANFKNREEEFGCSFERWHRLRLEFKQFTVLSRLRFIAVVGLYSSHDINAFY